MNYRTVTMVRFQLAGFLANLILWYPGRLLPVPILLTLCIWGDFWAPWPCPHSAHIPVPVPIPNK
jgi:hypothetical protein